MGRDRAALRKFGSGAAVVLPLAFLAVFFWFPVLSILERGLDGGLGNVWEVVSNRANRGVIWFTFWQAVVSTLLTMVLALPAAGALARYRLPGRGLIRAALTVPFVLPTVVVASAFRSVFEVFGLDQGELRLTNTVWAILIAHVFFNYSVVVRTVGAFWSGLDRRPEEAARMLGASRWQAFREVTLPQLMPSLAASGAIVFLFTFTSFGVVLILGGPTKATLETEIFRHATRRIDFSTAAVLALVQLVAVVALLVVSEVLRRRAEPAAAHRGVDQAQRPHGRQWWGVLASVGSGLVLVAVPLLVLLERSLATGDRYSFDNFRRLNSNPDFSGLFVPPVEAIGNSLLYAGLATAVAVLVGLPAALVVVHGKRGLSRLFDVAFTVPLGTSAVTLGFGILIALDSGVLDLRTSWVMIPIVQGLIGIPFVMRAVVPTLKAIDDEVREVAAVLGASPARIRREIDLPIGSRGLLVGASFAFAVSLGEFGATTMLVRPERPTVPVAIFRLLGQSGEVPYGQAMALSVILVVLTGAAVFVIERLQPKAGLFS